MADNVILAMDDEELAAYVAGLKARLAVLPQGEPGREPLLEAYGSACAEANWRGLPDGGSPGDPQ